jgi:DNA polymerase-3 subunit gamma/tau
MSFVVSARKYRPQNFDELVGQDHIAQTLKNAIKNDKLAHAFLFSGPRGVGKTTSARILAKVLNCENLQEGYKACDSCASCKAFLENASFNIFELDAASNNSVDHIRALNEQVRFQPQQGSYKIYIIDEVHMLSPAAFNAFLKTLEEPPPYAKFILATTEKHKIIPTILSRCQIFDFRRIQIKDIVKQLRHIAEQEKREIDDDALHLIAQKSDGAMRDALSIYDKIISSVEGSIGFKEVAENLNVLDYDYYFRLVDFAVKEDLPQLMLLIDEIFKYGFEAEQLVLGLMEHLRQLLLVKDIQTAELIEAGENIRKRYENQAELTSQSFLLSSLSLLNMLDIELYKSQNKRLSTEIALSKICFLNRVVDKKKLFDELNEEETTVHKKAPEAPKKAQINPEKEVFDLDKNDNKSPGPAEKKAAPPPSAKMRTKVLGSSQKIVGPTLSTNVDALLSDLEQKDFARKSESQDYSGKTISKIFESYRENSESKSLKTALEFTAFELKEDEILVLTPTQIYIDYIRQELNLLEQLHHSFPGRDLKIKFEVKEESFPNYTAPKKPKHLTTKEKYDLLNRMNPDFQKLVNEFKLKIKS